MSGKCFTRLTLLAADDKPNELFCYLLLNTLEMVLEKQLECPIKSAIRQQIQL